MITPSRSISRLLEIMAALREPNSGCPWDVEQDFVSIAPYTIEEAYEVADAIERQDMDDLRLELGDLLLQVVYHSQMASELNQFDFGDVVEAITTKMIRRHPHVFGTEDVSAEIYSAKGMEEGTWERIKTEEKQEAVERRKALGLPPKDAGKTLLDDIPSNLPALIRAYKLQKKAASVGFDWDRPEDVMAKLHEEIDELRDALESKNHESIEDEFGDVLFSIMNLGRHYKLDGEKALSGTNQKFKNRFDYIEKELLKRDKSLAQSNLEEMETLWNEAKLQEG